MLLLVLIASSRNVESSTGSGIIAGNNGKEISSSTTADSMRIITEKLEPKTLLFSFSCYL